MADTIAIPQSSHRDDSCGFSLPPVYRLESDLGVGVDCNSAIIQAENLATMNHLVDSIAGTVRCVYMDPPYNNQEVYRHYRDKQSHADWLGQLATRLETIRTLLTPDGSVWISIDDRAMHYLKVLADEIFGRANFVNTIVWQQRTTRENRKVFSNDHEYVLVYALDARAFKRSRNLLPPTEALLSRYKNPDNDPRGRWQSVSANVQDGHSTRAQHYELTAPNGNVHRPPEGRCWVYAKEKMEAEIEKGNIWFGKTGDGVPRIKRFLHDASVGLTPPTLWLGSEVGTNDEAKKHLLKLFPDQPIFDTPKPENLLHRILHIATDPGDLVLDPYLGSGTTAAVAHKMDRRYIGIEQGDHAVEYCAKRLHMVVHGESGGCSETVGWTGGGSFAFFKRAE